MYDYTSPLALLAAFNSDPNDSRSIARQRIQSMLLSQLSHVRSFYAVLRPFTFSIMNHRALTCIVGQQL